MDRTTTRTIAPTSRTNASNLERGTPIEEAGHPAVAIVGADSSLYNTLDTMITSYKGSAILVDDDGRYKGVVDFDSVLEATNAMRPQEQVHEEV